MTFLKTNKSGKPKENSLFVEKYRPTELVDYIGNKQLKDTVEQFIEKKDVPHLLLHGKAGGGKTTLAKLIIKRIDCDDLIINASDENGIDVIRSKIKTFASTVGFNSLKIVLLDEADYLSLPAQATLRSVMETYSKHCRFILTCNYLEKVLNPIRSRCQEFHIIPPSKDEVELRVVHILDSEKIKYDVKDITPIIDAYYPDIRKIISTAQLNSSDGELKVDEEKLTNSNAGYRIVEILKGAGSVENKYKKIRRIIEDSRIQDFTDLYTYLFEEVEEYGGNKTLEIIVMLGDGQYKEAMVVDKKLQFIVVIINILEL